MQPPPCCPAGAEPLRLMADYVPKGETLALEPTLPCYVARPPGPAKRGVVMFTDMFGVDTGRHRQFCDQLADEGFLAVCPNFFAGNPYVKNPPTFGKSFGCLAQFICGICTGGLKRRSATHAWDVSMRRRVVEVTVAWMRSQGVKDFAAVGFCWGAYGSMKCGSLPEFKCTASFHPSVDGFCKATKEDDLQVCREMRSPMLMYVTTMEAKEWQPGGAAQAACEAAVPGGVVWEFIPGVSHGYMTRGDTKKPEVLAAVAKGWGAALELFKAKMP